MRRRPARTRSTYGPAWLRKAQGVTRPDWASPRPPPDTTVPDDVSPGLDSRAPGHGGAGRQGLDQAPDGVDAGVAAAPPRCRPQLRCRPCGRFGGQPATGRSMTETRTGLPVSRGAAGAAGNEPPDAAPDLVSHCAGRPLHLDGAPAGTCHRSDSGDRDAARPGRFRQRRGRYYSWRIAETGVRGT